MNAAVDRQRGDDAEHTDHGPEQRRSHGNTRPPAAPLERHAGADPDDERCTAPNRGDHHRRGLCGALGGEPNRSPRDERDADEHERRGHEDAGDEHGPVGVDAHVHVFRRAALDSAQQRPRLYHRAELVKELSAAVQVDGANLSAEGVGLDSIRQDDCRSRRDPAADGTNRVS